MRKTNGPRATEGGAPAQAAIRAEGLAAAAEATLRPNEPAIETIDLVKDYWDRETSFFLKRKKRVVDHVNLKIKSGEVYGFLGKNGAGKTTTIKMILGLTFPTSGSIRIFGQQGASPHTKALIGFAPEKPSFYNHLTAEEVMLYAGELMGLARKQVLERIGPLLELVGLADDGKTLVMNFSKGMQQRLGVAQSLIADPRLLIFDEPATGLDPFGRKFVKNLIAQLKAEGRTVFFSSHQLLDVQEVCDRVGIIHQGRLIVQDTVASVLAGGTNLEERFVEMITALGEKEAVADPKKVGE